MIHEIYHVLTTVHLRITWKARVACDLNFITKDEGPEGHRQLHTLEKW